MPIKISGYKSLSQNQGMVNIEARCVGTTLGEDTTDQKKVLIQELTKALQQLSDPDKKYFTLNIVLGVNTLQDIAKQIKQKEANQKWETT